jgi:hypothetical protein
MLAHRVKTAAEMNKDTAVGYMRGGLALRLVFVSLVGIMAIKIPGLSFLPVLLGLFTFQIIIHINGFFSVITNIFSQK